MENLGLKKFLQRDLLKKIYIYFAMKFQPWKWLCITYFINRFLVPRNNRILDINQVNQVIILEMKATNDIKRSEENGKQPNLEKLLVTWFRENMNYNIKYMKYNELENNAIYSKTIVIFREYFVKLNVIKATLVAIRLRKLKLPLFIFITDTYNPLYHWMSFIVAATKGVTVNLPNTSMEASKFGHPFSSPPIFWTWPKSRYDERPRNTWQNRGNICIFPSLGAASEERSYLNELMRKTILPKSYKTVQVGGLEKADYLNLLSKSKLYYTTSLVQKDFIVGPKFYQSKISLTTATGQIWEAFGSGCVLITHHNEVLKELGFKEGRDFLDLNALLNELGNFPSDYDLEKIASNGNLLFESIIINSRL